MDREDRIFAGFIIATVIFSALIINAVFLPFDNDSAPSETIDGPQPILVTDEGDKRLYRLDLTDGPLYYYLCDTEDGQITKMVAFATVTMSISVE